MTIYTIGFTKKSASKFFDLLQHSGAKRVVDVRLNNVSQLAGFAKRDDLKYFLEKICGMEYVHQPLLAPTQDMLDEYKKNGGDWATYEARFVDLMEKRRIEREIPREEVIDGCLLCSEDKPHHCHRRIVAEYFQRHWGELDISHLS
ncbi:DUF488 family protein [Hydrogenophaga sp.]|uniref:DUF488 domain-containing protein n=1 Tax=Hydrogenophaga sp. TaxID=1904254 RepID=UPI002732628D|nr:DUF488 domain-containing protein [Hydrogenophaga sp.]MDP3884498.1 DUF488 domain-containing protein [Hydrogenophaga sp.]